MLDARGLKPLKPCEEKLIELENQLFSLQRQLGDSQRETAKWQDCVLRIIQRWHHA
jgi:hypothetical protein